VRPVNSKVSATPVIRAYLELKHLSKDYAGEAWAVSDLNLAIREGEMISLLGPSGCGKTTTLRMIAGLVEPSAGSIMLNGNDVTVLPAHRRNIGVVFQSYALFPHLSVFDNVAFGLRMRRVSGPTMHDKVRQALALVHLENFSKRQPRELSGGQQQRVALARALVIEPTLLLLDEPLSNLDAKLRETMRDEIRRIQQELGMTAVFVTHDQGEALAISDRIAVMRNGSIVQLGTPSEIYRTPASSFVAKFVGRVNVFTVQSHHRSASSMILMTKEGLKFTIPCDRASSIPGEILIRPHDISLERHIPDNSDAASSCNTAIGCVSRIVYAGDVTEYHVRLHDTSIVSEVPAALRMQLPEVGDTVRLCWRDDDLHYFDD